MFVSPPILMSQFSCVIVLTLLSVINMLLNKMYHMFTRVDKLPSDPDYFHTQVTHAVRALYTGRASKVLHK